MAEVRNGRATCKVRASLKPGRYAVIATYPGDSQHLADRDRFRFRKLR